MPEKGSAWRHPRMRGTWKVVSVGRSYVTLRSVNPVLDRHRVDRAMWPGLWHETNA